MSFKKISFCICLVFLYPATAGAFGFEHKETHVLESVQGTDINDDAVGDMVVDDNTLYISTGNPNTPNLEVIDITDPANPVALGVLTDAHLGSAAVDEGFTVNDGYLYIPAFRELVVVDVRDVDNPLVTSRITQSNLPSGDMLVYEGVLYIKSNDDVIITYDVSNPGVPVFLGQMDGDSISQTSGQGEILNIVGDYLYLKQDSVNTIDGEVEPGGVRSINISDPANPVHERSYIHSSHQLQAWDQSKMSETEMLAVNRSGNFVHISFVGDGNVLFREGSASAGSMQSVLEKDGYIISATSWASNSPMVDVLNIYTENGANQYDEVFTLNTQERPSLIAMKSAIFANGHYIALIDGTRNEFGTTQLEIFSTIDHVYRFWSDTFQAHFFTSSLAERDYVIANDPNWTYEGVTYETAQRSLGGAPTYRFWSPIYRNHFYTTSTIERDSLIENDPNWTYEGEAFSVYGTNTTDTLNPVYRFYSENFQGHFYTVSQSEKEYIQANDLNWQYEGVAWYAK